MDELLRMTKDYIKDLGEDMYFSISIVEAEKLKILPTLAKNLCLSFRLEEIYFNKNEVFYFNLKEENGTIKFTPKLIKYAFDNGMTPVKLSWNEEEMELSTKIYLSSFFLWLSMGIKLIEKDKSDYNLFKNEMLSKILQFGSSKEVICKILEEILKFIEPRTTQGGYLHLLHLDLNIIYDNFKKVETNIALPYESNNDSIPMKIALLNEIGFFELSSIKLLPKKKQREIVNKLIGGSDRHLKGNINILNLGSNEDGLKYTSHKHIEEMKKFITNLSK